MSRHHMLPPIISPLPPQPKKIETRKRGIQLGTVGGMDDVGETHGTAAFDPSMPVDHQLLPQNFPAIEGSDSKPQHPRGRLSESTLKLMLQVQEMT